MEANKYLDALKKHPLKLTDEEAKRSVDQIIKSGFDNNNNYEVYKTLYSCIDHTSLNTTDSKEYIWNFTEKINAFEGSEICKINRRNGISQCKRICFLCENRKNCRCRISQSR
jgi:hypothetical protein